MMLFCLIWYDNGNACTFSEIDCNVENVFEVDSVKLDMALILNDRQDLVQFSFSIGDDLEMGDSSGPPFQVYEGLEMCDSSCLISISSSFAVSQKPVSMEAEVCSSEGLVIEWHAVHSLWLFFIEVSVLGFGAKFSFEVTRFIIPQAPPLGVHDEVIWMIDSTEAF